MYIYIYIYAYIITGISVFRPGSDAMCYDAIVNITCVWFCIIYHIYIYVYIYTYTCISLSLSIYIYTYIHA